MKRILVAFAVVAAAFTLQSHTVYPYDSCPEGWSSSGGTYYLPDIDDCHFYYECDSHDRPVLKECPPGLVWDVNLEVCNWPEDNTTPWRC